MRKAFFQLSSAIYANLVSFKQLNNNKVLVKGALRIISLIRNNVKLILVFLDVLN